MSLTMKTQPHTVVVRHLLEHCGNLRAGERFLLLVDQTTVNLAAMFLASARLLGATTEIVEIPVADRHGQEPTADAAGRMAEADLVAGLTRMSLAHTQARQRLCARGGRYLSLA